MQDPNAVQVRSALRHQFEAVRALSVQLARPLSAEDQVVQSMPDASPTKWHLAHITWFFETVVLQAFAPRYRVYDERFGYLFNSYYEAIGPRHPRPQRGLLTRPSADEVMAYRSHVDVALATFIECAEPAALAAAVPLITLGLHHEQQHQELLLTDTKHMLAQNPLQPAYREHAAQAGLACASPLRWLSFAGGQVDVGHCGDGFAFDNEMPRHPVLLQPFQLASRTVTCGEYLQFMRDGGYSNPALWLSQGWDEVNAQGWQAPMYWSDVDAEVPTVYTLLGPRPMNPAEPVCHLSLYEAAAYAQWSGARLPTEFEWEHAAASLPVGPPQPGAAGMPGSPAMQMRHDPLYPHPVPAADAEGLQQMFGEVWEWTRSSYDPYPGFQPMAGAVAEYNGKFMVGQTVLRGGSCASPAGHLRPSYRNFFPPGTRWQFSGIRLAKDLAR